MIGSMLGIYKERIDPSLAGTPDLGTTENGGDQLIGTLVNVGTSPLGPTHFLGGTRERIEQNS